MIIPAFLLPLGPILALASSDQKALALTSGDQKVLALASGADQKPLEVEEECPASLRVIVPGGKFSMTSLHDHLKHCHNTTELDLQVTIGGCTEFPDRWDLPFNLAGGDRYPNLTSLKLQGYDFDSEQWKVAFWGQGPWQTWFETNFAKLKLWLKGVPMARLDMTGVDLWLEAMDWSHLETLSIAGDISDRLAELMPPHLTSLKKTAIWGGRDKGASLGKFLQRLPSGLESLTWRNEWHTSSSAFRDVIAKHGATLTNLDIHYKNIYWNESNRTWHQLSPDDFAFLAEKAPHLRTLSLNVARNVTWDWKALERIASLKNLESVHLWLELGSDIQRQDNGNRNLWSPCCRQPNGIFREPQLNDRTVSDAFAFMKSKNTSGNLRNATFSSGDLATYDHGMLPPWYENMMIRIVCQDREGEAGCETKLATAYPREELIVTGYKELLKEIGYQFSRDEKNMTSEELWNRWKR